MTGRMIGGEPEHPFDEAFGVSPRTRTTSSGSHRRTNLPGREFRRAEIELLALRPLAAGDLQDQLEDPAPGLLDGLFAVEDRAAIDVHVLLEPPVHGRVRGDLDRRRRLAAEDATAAGGEADEIGPTGH